MTIRAVCGLALALAITSIGGKASALTFSVVLDGKIVAEPLTGRVFVILAKSRDPEPRLQADSVESPPLFGVAANELQPETPLTVGGNALGSPVRRLRDLPPGTYFIQAFARRFVRYPRADGHVIWGLDQWFGQDGFESAGMLYSDIKRVQIAKADGRDIVIRISHITLRKQAAPDTRWLKHIKFRSALLSKFWGRPIYLGVDLLLPKEYFNGEAKKFPIIYELRNHYLRTPPFDFSERDHGETTEERVVREQTGGESGHKFYEEWTTGNIRQVIEAQIFEPTPFFDYSASMNSANNGPYEDAVMNELIPYIETTFRVIGTPDGRGVLGKSTGGRDALSLITHHPDFFRSAWIFYPCSFDYSDYYSQDIYNGTNAFEDDSHAGFGPKVEHLFFRTLGGGAAMTLRDWALHEAVVGGDSGVGAEFTGSENALNSPIGKDGYPTHRFDLITGEINPSTTNEWRRHDVAAFLRSNIKIIAPKLQGKLHFFVGDRDEWFRNYQVHDLERFLSASSETNRIATFRYGPFGGHPWQPMKNSELVNMIASELSPVNELRK